MYRILKNFTDKNTKKKYKVGDEENFTEDRANEILAFGEYIEFIQPASLPEDVTPEDANPQGDDNTEDNDTITPEDVTPEDANPQGDDNKVISSKKNNK